MRLLKSPLILALLAALAGLAVVLYVIAAPSVQPGPAGDLAAAELAVGEMADFEFAAEAVAAPDIAFEHEGADMTLADFRGRVVLVNFWATWCAPCLKELPSLDALQAALGGEDFQVVAIASDAGGPEKAAQFLERLEIAHLALYADPRLRLVSAVGAGGVLPLSILYGRDGREIGRLVGEADWASPEARRLIERAVSAGDVASGA